MAERNEAAGGGELWMLPGAEGFSGVRMRPMGDVDLERVRELRSVVRWAADPRAFDLLRGMREARWTVADDHRNMGLGVRLSAWAVAYLRSQGAEVIRLYSTRQAEGLYRSLGFRSCAPRTVYRLDEATRAGGREEVDGHRVGTLSFGDLPELYGLDHWSYGADRSALIFATLRLHPGGGLIARDSSGRIKGYLLRSYSERVDRIGPFVASTPDVARLLLAAALRAGGGSPVEVTVPGVVESPAHELFREFGFRGRSDRLQMELGEEGGVLRMEHYGTTPYLAT
jgi:GNAT superfamily N-acetyltransferase